jgi:hypothetical protein
MIRPLALAALVAAVAPAVASASPSADGKPASRAARRRGAARPDRAPATARVAEADHTPGDRAIAIRHRDDMGAVVHVTTARAYLDVGADVGLAPGQTLQLLRGGAAASTCDVEMVAPHHATCKVDGYAKRGDLFRVTPPSAPPPPKPLPPIVAADELERRAAFIAEQPHGRTEPKTNGAAQLDSGMRRSEVGVSHGVWSSTGFSAWNEERVDAVLRGVPAFAGLVFDADVQAVHWTTRAETFRALPRERSRLYVYEAALSSRDPGRSWAGALGRVSPWNVPGATTFDGVQLALVPASRGGELGVFGGLVPDPVTLAVDTGRSTAGVYGSLDLGGGALSSRTQARAAVVTSPELGTRLEGEVRSFLLVGRTVNIEGMLRAGAGGQHQAPNLLDLAQIDLSGRPLPRLALSGLFRYAGLDVPDAAAPALFPGHERRWDGSAGYEIGPALVSAAGGWGQDLGTGLERWFAGPELSFPRVLGPGGGVSLGYAEERGWIAGRTAWLQAWMRAAQRVRLSGRLTWTEDTRPGGDADHAVGALLTASADVGRWVVINGSVLARVGAQASTSGLQDTSSGIAARLGLACRF